jgi:hypothetical protein
MNPMMKAWLQDTLKKAAANGGLTVFDEFLETLSTDIIQHGRDACDRILKKRADEATNTREAKVV